MFDLLRHLFESSTVQIVLISFLVCALATWAMRMVAPLLGYMDLPGKERFHENVTPLLGGAAIFCTIVIVGVGLVVGRDSRILFDRQHILFYTGLSSLFVMGLIDDRRAISPIAKLIVQFFAALAFTNAGFRLHLFPSEFVNQVVSLIWIVGLVNAMNLLDNIDGLCASVGVIGCGGLVLFLSAANDPRMAILAAITMGACGGFLTQNFRHAKIFLGDAGSMLIGGLLAGLSLKSTEGGGLPVHLALPILLSVPIFDTALVSVHRLLNGRGVMQGGKDHLSHRLSNHYKLGPTKSVALIATYAVGAAVVAWLVRNSFSETTGVVFLGMGVLAMGGLIAGLKNSYIYPKLSTSAPPAAETDNVFSMEDATPRSRARKRRAQ